MAAKTKKTNAQVILSTLKTRKNGFTDAELIAKTGIKCAQSVRSHLLKDGAVVAVGKKKDAATNRTVTTYAVSSSD